MSPIAESGSAGANAGSGEAAILLVEDREDDRLIIAKAFAAANLHNPVHVVTDGEQALFYLKGELQYADREKYPLPKLILLDLRMPRMDGFEVLRWIRSQPQFAEVIIIVLTSSNNIRDLQQAYQLGANSFMIKPDEFQNVHGIATLLKDYWLKGITPPAPFPEPPPAPPA